MMGGASLKGEKPLSLLQGYSNSDKHRMIRPALTSALTQNDHDSSLRDRGTQVVELGTVLDTVPYGVLSHGSVSPALQMLRPDGQSRVALGPELDGIATHVADMVVPILLKGLALPGALPAHVDLTDNGESMAARLSGGITERAHQRVRPLMNEAVLSAMDRPLKFPPTFGMRISTSDPQRTDRTGRGRAPPRGRTPLTTTTWITPAPCAYRRLVALTFCDDLTPADWLADNSTPPGQLLRFGPIGFAQYARVLFMPDPADGGQQEADVDLDPEHPSEIEITRRALRVLADFTETPDRCYFCVWDGYSDVRLPTPSDNIPVLRGPDRQYFLLQGSLTDFGTWEAVLDTDERPPPPAFAWPADRKWCFASDVDPHWAGVGGTLEAITALGQDTQLELIATNPATAQPQYR
jgi:hypothetical protein